MTEGPGRFKIEKLRAGEYKLFGDDGNGRLVRSMDYGIAVEQQAACRINGEATCARFSHDRDGAEHE